MKYVGQVFAESEGMNAEQLRKIYTEVLEQPASKELGADLAQVRTVYGISMYKYVVIIDLFKKE